MKRVYFLTFVSVFMVFMFGCSEKLLYLDDKKISNLGVISILGDKFEAAYRDKDQNSVSTKVHDVSSWQIDDFIKQESKAVLDKYTSYNVKVIDSSEIDLKQYYGGDSNETTLYRDESLKKLLLENAIDHLVVIELGDYLPEDDIDIVGVGVEKVKEADFHKLVVAVNIHAKMYGLYKDNLELRSHENIAIIKKADDKLWINLNKSIEPKNLYTLEKIIKDVLKKRVVTTSLKAVGFTIFTTDHSSRTSNSYE